jgi:hypothetical protein
VTAVVSGRPTAGSSVQDAQRAAVRRALRLGGPRGGDPEGGDLWLRYFALGGTAGPDEVADFARGGPFDVLQGDLLARAVNERIDERTGTLRAPYSRPLRTRTPAGGALRALTTVLDGALRAQSGEFGAVVQEAGRALDVELVVYLVDYEQRLLVPLDPPAAERHREPLSVERTLPGRAFRHQRTEAAPTDGRPRWWVPLVDGSERLGVLDVVPVRAGDLADPVLREQCELLARQVAHLVAAVDRHGDVVDRVRRGRARTASAELVWRLLPPLSAATRNFSVSGLLEPADDVGGDVFDYALSADQVDLALFDAMGHSLEAGLIVSAAVAAYRTARRDGHSLFAQATAVDDAISETFPEGMATGVLAHVDLPTGTLRYVCAGHPEPLVLRGGRVVLDLVEGRRTPFGLPTGELVVGEARLEPGDWLVLYTDGVVEARDAAGEFFGRRRLTDFLERAVAADFGTSETVRRLVQAILDHQGDVLQDDATVLLARWQGGGAG